MTGVDRLSSNTTTFTVNGLKSFALYQFSLVAINKHGRSRAVHTQEYTGKSIKIFQITFRNVSKSISEPSTVPLNIRAASVSDTVAKIAWDPPARNKLGPRVPVL